LDFHFNTAFYKFDAFQSHGHEKSKPPKPFCVDGSYGGLAGTIINDDQGFAAKMEQRIFSGDGLAAIEYPSARDMINIPVVQFVTVVFHPRRVFSYGNSYTSDHADLPLDKEQRDGEQTKSGALHLETRRCLYCSHAEAYRRQYNKDCF